MVRNNMNKIPESHIDILNKKSFAHLATIMPDGTPQVTPVWVDYDGEYIVINSARGRVKTRNMQVGSPVAVEIMDADNPYRYLQVRGKVAVATEEGADAVIDSLAKKYMGADSYPFRREGEVRVTYKISVDKLDLH
jgi:PPOX class probable F420-dependent enzyme